MAACLGPIRLQEPHPPPQPPRVAVAPLASICGADSTDDIRWRTRSRVGSEKRAPCPSGPPPPPPPGLPPCSARSPPCSARSGPRSPPKRRDDFLPRAQPDSRSLSERRDDSPKRLDDSSKRRDDSPQRQDDSPVWGLEKTSSRVSHSTHGSFSYGLSSPGSSVGPFSVIFGNPGLVQQWTPTQRFPCRFVPPQQQPDTGMDGGLPRANTYHFFPSSPPACNSPPYSARRFTTQPPASAKRPQPPQRQTPREPLSEPKEASPRKVTLVQPPPPACNEEQETGAGADTTGPRLLRMPRLSVCRRPSSLPPNDSSETMYLQFLDFTPTFSEGPSSHSSPRSRSQTWDGRSSHSSPRGGDRPKSRSSQCLSQMLTQVAQSLQEG